MSPPRCLNHPDRAPRGLCVSCRKLFCQDCITRVRGTNRCAGCLHQENVEPAVATKIRHENPQGFTPFGVFLALTLFLSLTAGLFFVLEVTL